MHLEDKQSFESGQNWWRKSHSSGEFRGSRGRSWEWGHPFCRTYHHMMNTGLDRLDLYVLRMLETIGIDLKLVEKDEKYSMGLSWLGFFDEWIPLCINCAIFWMDWDRVLVLPCACISHMTRAQETRYS